MKIRKLVAATVATTSLAFGVGATALATAASAEETTPSTLPAAVCQRAHDRYVKLVEANQKAKAEYQKARALPGRAARQRSRGGRAPARHPPRPAAPGPHPGRRGGPQDPGQGPGPLRRPRPRSRADRRLTALPLAHMGPAPVGPMSPGRGQLTGAASGSKNLTSGWVRSTGGAAAWTSSFACATDVASNAARRAAELDRDAVRVLGVDRRAPAVVDLDDGLAVGDPPLLVRLERRRGRARRTRGGSSTWGARGRG